ncbi:PREDICTED: replication protein A 32 kDa subunit A-like [Fragaria vesca subsp. vesca]|uniref:replication protein A 32 kDa subunit A-like n=1 Tax=Fragaria vesca subsp. vesca TaxID=101020 RepID=UPI0002C32908|nr:PREDICTED: replication protein A 32 kDa subunit A-like [Fragaria vesca subsp. vesca]
MFSGSQFDASSAFGGGGFMSSQATQFGGDSNSSSARSRESHGLVPVTVKQISEAHQSGDEKSNFVIGGVDVANVSLLGMVFEKVEKTTDVSFTIDDGTGRIKCRRWVNEAFDSTEMEAVEDGMYVRVNGNLKVFQGVRQIGAFSVRPVKNFDEVAFHYIECIYNHLRLQKLQGIAVNQPQPMGSSVYTPVKSEPSGYQTASSNQLSGQFTADGRKSVHELIIEYMRLQPSSTNGTSTQELSQRLNLPMEKIMDAIRPLEADGELYSTIDEFHYKIADE